MCWMKDTDGVDRTVQELVEAYWNHHRLAHSSKRPERLASQEWQWAWDAVHDAVGRRDPELLRLIMPLADAVAGDEAALEVLGAGLFEDLLVGEGFGVDELAAAARQNANVRRSIRAVWWTEADPEVEAMFRRYS